MTTAKTAPTDAETALAKRDEIIGELEGIEAVVDQCNLSTMDNQGAFAQAFTLSYGIQRLREMITHDHMQLIMPLQGSALGFRTDKDNQQGYPENIVKECLIEALLRGLRPVGNEFNIIAARSYTTKEGFVRKVREYPGITNFGMSFGIPHIEEGGRRAQVMCIARWRRDDVEDELKRQFPIRINQGQGDDAILGKAKRKLMAAVWERWNGSAFQLPEGDVEDAPARHVDAKQLPDTNGKKEGLFGFGQGQGQAGKPGTPQQKPAASPEPAPAPGSAPAPAPAPAQ